MYLRSARYYDLLYGFKNYAAASANLEEAIHRHRPRATTLLDVACGTGRHLEHLRASFNVEGLDINEQLLAIARQRVSGVPLHVGDMVSFSLPHTYDVITCLFGSIAYVKTQESLFSAVSSMRRHLEPGGMVVLEPWFTPETLWTHTITANFVDEPELKITWMYATGEPKDGRIVLDIQYLVGTPGGVEHFTEQHEFGVFSDAEYRAALETSGLTVVHETEGLFGRGLYIGLS